MNGMPTSNIQAIGQMVEMIDFGSRAYVCELEKLRITLAEIERRAPGMTIEELLQGIISGEESFEAILKAAFLEEMTGR